MPDLIDQLDDVMPTAIVGRLVRTVGATASVAGFRVPLGAIAHIDRPNRPPVPAEVVGFRDDLTLVCPLADMDGVRHGSPVRLRRTSNWLRVGPGLLGRVIDACGQPIDGKPASALTDRVPLAGHAPDPVARPRIAEPFSTGIRALDGLLTCGKGQRMGIFAGSGVGKSVLLGMLARRATAGVNVIALIGERGREVNEFLQRDLTEAGLAKSVVVVATSDQPALVRTRAAFAATAIAEYFRDQGIDVLLLMDSVTRFALARREVGLAAGEPPTTRGYTPSVFAQLPKLVERAGLSQRGSITAFYSVLVEADDPNEPISDALRGLLDGHTWLARKLASRGHYPAIDVLESLSRLMPEVTTAEHRAAATAIRELLAVYRDHEDLISIGAYRRGGNAKLDRAVELLEPIQEFLRQGVDEACTIESARAALSELWKSATCLGE
ncbi:MAG: FliI/YscN family ATPase [Planctomycetia bacterium]|nr:FliI/YscN family ATPase [Planctomycetia bacterium]